MNKNGRALVLVDIENVYGVGDTPGQVREYWDNTLIAHAIPSDKCNDYIVGASFQNAIDLFDLPDNVKNVLGDGPDAGELALIESIDYRTLVKDYDRLVIVSGDRKFIPVVSLVHKLGIEVVVISNNNVATKLKKSADWYIRLKTKKEKQEILTKS